MTPRQLQAFRLSFRAEEAVELPCLPTVVVRSVFGLALRQLTCRQPDRTACEGCSRMDRCVYVTLFEPDGIAARLGVTRGAPAPFVMAPECPTLGEGPVLLPKGGQLALRVVLIGAARAHADLAIAALRAGLARGVGRSRASLKLAEVRNEPIALAAPSNAAELDLVTPLRLTSAGKVRSRFSAEDLVQGIARRIRTLRVLYGTGSDTVDAPGAGDWRLSFNDLRIVHVRRWSGRQKARMALPGVVGRLALRGDLAGVWPWLALGEWVQVGKGTSMGFGRYRLRAVA